MSSVPEVLTDIPGNPGRFWGDHTTWIGPSQPPAWLLKLLGRRWAYNLIGVLAGIRLFLRRHRCRGVVTDGGASGVLFSFLQWLCPWGRKPHVMIDCNWYAEANPWRGWLKRLRLQLASRSVHRFVVWASHEREDYARTFQIPQAKLHYIPFHHTLHDYQYEIRDEGYLFAGGNYDRDYPTLIEAVRPLNCPVWIATTRRRELLGDLPLPHQVRVEGTTAAGFRQALAGARLVVVPMQAGLLHSGGQQTCLNAMLLGKPTIAVGQRWATDLLEDGVHGLIVDYQDVQGLRDAISWVLAHPNEAREMAERGKIHAAQFTTQRCMQAVYELTLPLCSRPSPTEGRGEKSLVPGPAL